LVFLSQFTYGNLEITTKQTLLLELLE
jgi:hypothetical protein